MIEYKWRKPLGVTIAVAVLPLPEEVFLPSSVYSEGGDTMGYITLHDLLQIALLITSILSCYYSKKR